MRVLEVNSGQGTATPSVLVPVRPPSPCRPNGVRTYRIPGGAQSRKGSGCVERPMFRVCIFFAAGQPTDVTCELPGC